MHPLLPVVIVCLAAAVLGSVFTVRYGLWYVIRGGGGHCILAQLSSSRGEFTSIYFSQGLRCLQICKISPPWYLVPCSMYSTVILSGGGPVSGGSWDAQGNA